MKLAMKTLLSTTTTTTTTMGTVPSLRALQDSLTTSGVTRRQWNWSTIRQKSRDEYIPQSVGKWWFDCYIESRNIPQLSSRSSHISRIMESELGVQLCGENACDNCRAEGAECWVYSENGRRQVIHPGSACARCRSRGPKETVCSASKRQPRRRKAPGRPSTRDLLPHPGRSRL
jgi:hypothetical protein